MNKKELFFKIINIIKQTQTQLISSFACILTESQTSLIYEKRRLYPLELDEIHFNYLNLSPNHTLAAVTTSFGRHPSLSQPDLPYCSHLASALVHLEGSTPKFSDTTVQHSVMPHAISLRHRTKSLHDSTTSTKSDPKNVPSLSSSPTLSTPSRLLFPQLAWNSFPDVPKGPLTPDPWDRPMVPTGKGVYWPFLSTQLSHLSWLSTDLCVPSLCPNVCARCSAVSDCLPPCGP